MNMLVNCPTAMYIMLQLIPIRSQPTSNNFLLHCTELQQVAPYLSNYKTMESPKKQLQSAEKGSDNFSANVAESVVKAMRWFLMTKHSCWVQITGQKSAEKLALTSSLRAWRSSFAAASLARSFSKRF